MSIVMHELPPFENMQAAAACRAIIPRIPQGEIYDGIILKLGGTFVAADIEEIKLNLGGKTIVELSGDELDTINKYNKLTNNADYLPIWFVDRSARTLGGERIGALDTRNFTYSEFSLEVKVDGTQTGATLEAFAVKGAEKAPDVRHMFRAMVKSTVVPPSQATHDLAISTGSEKGNLIRQLNFFHANMTHFELRKDTVPVSSKLAIADYQFLQDEVERSSQAGHFCYDAIYTGNQSNVVDTRRANGMPASMRYMATTSAADTIAVVADLYASIETL